MLVVVVASLVVLSRLVAGLVGELVGGLVVASTTLHANSRVLL